MIAVPNLEVKCLDTFVPLPQYQWILKLFCPILPTHFKVIRRIWVAANVIKFNAKNAWRLWFHVKNIVNIILDVLCDLTSSLMIIFQNVWKSKIISIRWVEYACEIYTTAVLKTGLAGLTARCLIDQGPGQNPKAMCHQCEWLVVNLSKALHNAMQLWTLFINMHLL